MVVTASLRLVSAAVAAGLLSACVSSSEGDGDCVSRYDPVASAPTWGDLEDAMLAHQEHGPVASVRVQGRGRDVGAGNEDAVRVVDLLDRRGRRLVQVDVWRTESGGWRAGVWSQCID